MPKKLYVGVNGVARKVTDGYIGVNNIARRIKKAYIGIGGVARPCWSEDWYYGTVTPLSVPRSNLAAASIGSYALFAGGQSTSGEVDVVDAYNAGLVRLSAPALDNPNAIIAAASNSTYTIFGGIPYLSTDINTGDVDTTLSTTDAYDSQLTHHLPYDLGNTLGTYIKAADGVNNALFVGADVFDGVTSKAVAYNTSLTEATHDGLSVSRDNTGACSANSYMLFAGGYTTDGSISSVVDAFTDSITRLLPSGLSTARFDTVGVRAGSYALFGGGIDSSWAESDVVDIYDAYLTRLTPLHLSTEYCYHAAVTLNDNAIFAGGDSTVADVFDSSLVRATHTGLSTKRSGLAAASVGAYALFGGGTDAVDAYTIPV